MNSYRLNRNAEKTEFVTQAKSPAAALRALCVEAGLSLASQDGRYGKLTDGTNVAALTMPYGRAQYADARTTRLLPGERP